MRLTWRVVSRRIGFWPGEQAFLLIETVSENGLHTAGGKRFDMEGSLAGGFDPFGGVVFCQAHDAEA